MHTVISNKIYVYGASIDLIKYCEKELIINNPLYTTLMRIGKQDQIARKHISQDMSLYTQNGTTLIIPFGCLYAIWNYIKNDPIETHFNDNGNVIDTNMEISLPLFDYQDLAVRQMIAARGGIMEGACGCGKTTIGIEIAKRIGKNTLWLCHTHDLLNQTVGRIKMLYPDLPVGTITSGKVNMVNNGITVSTIQTLVDIDDEIYKKNFDVIITDEVQHVSGSPTLRKMFAKVIERVPARYKFGLTATPERSDGLVKTIYTIVGCNMNGEYKPVFVIPKEKTNTLRANHIRKDINLPFDYASLNSDGTMNYIGLIDCLSNNEERNKIIVQDSINALEKHPKQIILCQRISQCETIHKMLLEQGVNAVLLVGKVTPKKRKEILGENRSWNVVVATFSLAKEGLDIPELSLLIYGMITVDKVATIQSAGRVERVCENKPHPEIYDYVDINFPYCVGKFKKRVNWLKKR